MISPDIVLQIMDPSQRWQPLCTPVHPPRLAETFHRPVELYELNEDPQEFDDRVDRPQMAVMRRKLLDRLHAWMATTADPLLIGIPVSPLYHRALAHLQGDVDAISGN